MSYAARAERYARDVVDGRVPAARPTRLACARHLTDLERAATDPAYPYRLDTTAADRVCRFVELLPHVKGRWARVSERIRLEDWQTFVLVSVFGWVRRADGLRRFRRVYLEVPRKNGKSTFTAGVGLYMLTADGEHGAEVYSGAGSEKQAWEVFRPALLMARTTPAFIEAYGVVPGAKNISVPARASRFEPVIGKPGDGASPSLAIHDEYHEHPTEEQYDTMLTGMGAREQPLSWVITTAGSDTAGPCYALRGELMDVLEGRADNERLFGVVYTVDPDDDWTSEAALVKANPNYGVSVSAEYLRAQQAEAVASPRKASTFKTKHLCVWVSAASPFLDPDEWNRCADPSLDPADFDGEPVHVGLDLSSRVDLAAAVRVFTREGPDGREHAYAFLRAYAPEARLGDPTCTVYVDWAATGELLATPGNVTDFDAIESDVLADAERYRIVEVRVDPWNATQLATHLAAAGIPVVEVPQTVSHLSEPMKYLQELVVDGRLHHDGNRVLAWAVGNLTAKIDRNDNVFPRKETPEKKIDPAVALILALGGVLRRAAPSAYETEPLLIV